MHRFPARYIPTTLSRKDKAKQYRMLQTSRKQYTKHNYYTRKQVASFKDKKSPHVTKARAIYKIQNITPNRQLAQKTGCSVAALQKIVNKGEGAYYSSGSRPNQTPQSWGLARLASSITSGKAAAVDYKIIDEGCDHKKKAFRLASKAKKTYKHGQRKVKKSTFLF
jgi:hypothetical protein